MVLCLLHGTTGRNALNTFTLYTKYAQDCGLFEIFRFFVYVRVYLGKQVHNRTFDFYCCYTTHVFFFFMETTRSSFFKLPLSVALEYYIIRPCLLKLDFK